MRKLLVLMLVLGIAGLNSGCAHTVKAIEHAKLQVQVKMKDSIFLSPGKNRNIYLRVTNTSEMQECEIEYLLAEKLAAKGYQRVSDPEKAAYHLQVNVLYFDLARQGMSPDAMLAGGAGGALAGIVLGGRGWRGPATGGLIGAAVGSIAGGLYRAALHIDTYIGAIDLQIGERGAAQAVAQKLAEQIGGLF